MDSIGPETLTRMETALNAVIERQNTLGPAGAAVAKNSFLIVSAFVAVGVVLGGILAFVTALIIASRLTKITEDMGELADGNLDVAIKKARKSKRLAR